MKMKPQDLCVSWYMYLIFVKTIHFQLSQALNTYLQAKILYQIQSIGVTIKYIVQIITREYLDSKMSLANKMAIRCHDYTNSYSLKVFNEIVSVSSFVCWFVFCAVCWHHPGSHWSAS